MTTTDTARKYYLLTTDDNPTPRIADFAALFPDGLEAGTTSEEVAALAPADLYHAGTWAVVACDLEILDAARDADDILADVRGAPAELADDETLAAAYLADRRANRERALVAANVRQLGPGPAAAADVRAAAAELEQLGMFVDQLELVPGFMPRAPARARTVGKLRALADACNRLAAIVEPPRDEAALLALAQLLAGAAPGEVEIDALDVDGALVAPLRWNGAAWAGRVGDITPPRRIDGFRFRRPGAYPSTVRARDIDLTGGLRGSVGAADLVDLKLGFTMPDGTAWPEIVVDSASLPRAVARFRASGDFAIGDDRGGAGDRCEVDDETGERALREHKRRADLDSRLGDALRASGINAADALAVQALYATAGQSGSHRIVSALRAIEAWIREGGAL